MSYHSLAMSTKFCLKWNDFQDNLNIAFKALRKDSNFTDVTLACEDGQQVEAHKVILAASSPFFQNLLQKNRHPHPLIYMRGMKSEDLDAIIDFLYFGETNILEENVNNFLAIADELELKGMSLNNGNKQKQKPKKQEQSPQSMPQKETDIKDENHPALIEDILQEVVTESMTPETPKQKTPKAKVPSGTSALLTSSFSEDFLELDGQIESMMTKGQNSMTYGSRSVITSVCAVCGKEGQTRNIKDHIEAKHIEGVAIPCNACDKTFRTRNSLRHHKCSM